MLRWTIVIAALGIYVLVVGCVLWQGDVSAQQGARTSAPQTLPVITTRDGLPICSVTMQIQRTDWIDKYLKSIDEVAALGADGVKFVVDTRQETVRSTRI